MKTKQPKRKKARETNDPPRARILAIVDEEKKRCAELCDSRGWEALEAARERIEGEIGGGE